ncbi:MULTISPECIES: zinc-binding alcohol dehydrogenase family protein [unclassified Janthinobacterium]|uniref:zinc-binding alcohol dehydrogenase family protein n=1 Tax=unclassified Janthinobacterium TaxID=2610881 RepID=UPI0004775A1A|nr:MULTISPECIES: zinc-binding alcohol dehydrogenase family protein [unclassified Janthinobacterium]MEC5163823.1 zinc-binding alcohol dehydrogenase family protein [Janthinobacterium sp. CG_S6]
MKAVAYRTSLPITHADALLDLELPAPRAGGRDLLVEVKAVSVNPVDAKMRKRAEPAPGAPQVLGWDAAGVVKAVGPDVTLFRPGDRVWYAGSIARPGSNSELHLVDERIVGHMPASLDFGAAAALPLTAITAWELLFERLQVGRGADAQGKSLLVVGAAGGVGSILVQLARQLTGLTVIGTASRPETADWVRRLGAHHVIDHGKPLSEEIARLGLPPVDYVASLTHSDAHFAQIVELIAPQGKLGLIDDPAELDVSLLKRKSISLHWELMFTRSLFQTADMHKQHELLDEVARLVDAGVLKSTLAERFGKIDAANLKRAHAVIESNKARGKIVLEGF